MNKKFACVAGLATAALLAGCSDKNEEPTSLIEAVSSKEADDVLVKLDDEKITAGMLKAQISDELMASYLDVLIENKILTSLYPPTEQEVKEKAIEMGLKFDELSESDLLEIRYEVAFEKGLEDVYTPVEDDMKSVYDEFYAESGVTYEEVEADLKQTVSNIKGSPILYDKIDEQKKKMDITFKDEILKKVYESNQN